MTWGISDYITVVAFTVIATIGVGYLIALPFLAWEFGNPPPTPIPPNPYELFKSPTCPTAAAVARKIADRADVGLAKYGTTLAGAGLSRREWLIHAQQEAMDMAVYLQRLIEMEDG